MAGEERAISVVVADDEDHVVEYLRTILHLEGFHVAGSASDAVGAAQAVEHLRPDVVLLDLHMPGGGLEAARLIGSLVPETHIVVFSSEVDDPDLLSLLRSGIDGYVVKGSPPERVAEAIRSAVAGGAYLTPEINRQAIGALTERLHAEQRADLLRQRERGRIDDAISERRFIAVHQPIVDLRSSQVVAVEALSRFTGVPQRPPDEWFAEADRAGRRVALELATAAAALRDLPNLRQGVQMTINVSPATALSGRLGEILVAAPLDRVILELTEHSPVTDYAALNTALAPWREKGARLAVDDAGGGYASFSHILRMQPEFIKFDLSLTRDIHLDRPRQALARALLGFAEEMGVGVVAEGIETDVELEVIAGLGAPYGQGFHLGRPRPLGEQPDLQARPDEPTQIELRDRSHRL